MTRLISAAALVTLGLLCGAASGCGGNVVAGSGGASSGSSNGGGTTTSNGGSGTTTTTTTSSSSSGGGCNPSCMLGQTCCGGACVNTANDIDNCGTCGHACTGTNPYCHKGVCDTPTCDTTGCKSGEVCCGMQCCGAGQICCDSYGPVVLQYPICTTPTSTGTCPAGCTACVCASPDTPIATPQGDRPIADLAPGDLVYSVQRDAVVAVPVLRINRAPVHDHHVVRVRLASGAVLEVSPRHPTADGRTFGDLRAGQALDRIPIVSVEVIPYAHPFTYDILPDSETHAYYAGGALIGTTLAP